MANIAIESLEQLKQLAYQKNGDFVEFYILLAGGLAKSSKRISYRPELDEFLIINEIDESYQEIHSTKIEIETNIQEAINKNCFFKY